MRVGTNPLINQKQGAEPEEHMETGNNAPLDGENIKGQHKTSLSELKKLLYFNAQHKGIVEVVFKCSYEKSNNRRQGVPGDFCERSFCIQSSERESRRICYSEIISIREGAIYLGGLIVNGEYDANFKEETFSEIQERRMKEITMEKIKRVEKAAEQFRSCAERMDEFLRSEENSK